MGLLLDIFSYAANNPAIFLIVVVTILALLAGASALGYTFYVSNRGFRLTKSVEHQIRQITVKEVFAKLQSTLSVIVEASFKSGWRCGAIHDAELLAAQMTGAKEILDEFTGSALIKIKDFIHKYYAAHGTQCVSEDDEMKSLASVFANFKALILWGLEATHKTYNWEQVVDFDELVEKKTNVLRRDSWKLCVDLYFPSSAHRLQRELLTDCFSLSSKLGLKEIYEAAIRDCFVLARKKQDEAKKQIKSEEDKLQAYLAQITTMESTVDIGQKQQGEQQ